MADLTNVGKKAEAKIKEWLNMPEEGFFFYRLPDQLNGFYGSTNPCDFIMFKKPHFYMIESKATYEDRFDFSMISENQHKDMIEASKVDGVKSIVIVLFASYKRAFILDINDIVASESAGKKSINIKKEPKWDIPHVEIPTVPSRKALLDYDKEFAIKHFQ